MQAELIEANKATASKIGGRPHMIGAGCALAAGSICFCAQGRTFSVAVYRATPT